ncbi:MAG: ATP-binding protein [Verrucomicrobia bacterium]|nr:ATP-binding protein [Verrucomicrobiota bacterium]
MKLKPWYDVVKPREDLREGRPLDASEFAANLEKVRLKSPNISKDYTDPARFFERTYLTENLVHMAGEVVRRLSGITTEASAVFNTMTQFGGGKTHALTLVYHLATCGPKANSLRGVSKILERAQVNAIPANCAVAVFVGMDFDAINGRGGSDGTPVRKTPWGEIAYQLGASISEERAKENFAQVAQHDAQFIEPKGDVIEKILPTDRPCPILMDEVLSFFSTYRQAGYGTKFYNFLQALSETVRGRNNCVLIVSAPKSDFDYCYTAEDVADLQRLENVLERLSKSVLLSAEADACEIIRRRLFEWDDRAVTSDGRVLLSKEAHDTCKAYGDWVQEHRQQLPDLVNPDIARDQLLASYPFHPMAISVFERKWQGLPRFQRTRGILRVLALWVSQAYQDGYKGAHCDPLVTLGTAPLENPLFRAAVFEQLGENRLEAAVTTDIAGRKDAHSIRLDSEAVDAIKKQRLHRKVATSIFFESNGGQVGQEAKEASLPEIRLAVGEPDSDIGNVETVLEALTQACYYLTVEKTRYKFSLKENLNKRFSDRRATIQTPQIDEQVRGEIQRIFAPKEFVERVFFPEKSIQISDRPALTLVVADLGRTMLDEAATAAFVDQMIRECGTSARTFQSAVIWIVADSPQALRDEARKLLAWEAIEDEDGETFDDTQKRQVDENIKKAKRDLREAVWRSYKHVLLLGKGNKLRNEDLGLVHSSALGPGSTPIDVVLNRLEKADDLERKGVSPNFLIRNWPPAFKEWPTKSVRDAFFASPQFPRLLNPETVKDTISRGVADGILAYVGKTASGDYKPFYFKQSLLPADVETAEEMFIVTKDTAEAFLKSRVQPPQPPPAPALEPPKEEAEDGRGPTPPPPTADSYAGLSWTGEVPPQKWMNFYTKVLSKFAAGLGLKLTVRFDATPEGGVSKQKLEETRSALRELNLNDDVAPKA